MMRQPMLLPVMRMVWRLLELLIVLPVLPLKERTMILADEGVVLMSGVPWLVAIVRLVTLILLGVDSALLLRAYYVHHPLWITWMVPWGFAVVMIGVALVQGRLLEGQDAEFLRLGSLLHIIGLTMILVGVLRSPLRVGLFKRRHV